MLIDPKILCSFLIIILLDCAAEDVLVSWLAKLQPIISFVYNCLGAVKLKTKKTFLCSITLVMYDTFVPKFI